MIKSSALATVAAEEITRHRQQLQHQQQQQTQLQRLQNSRSPQNSNSMKDAFIREEITRQHQQLQQQQQKEKEKLFAQKMHEHGTMSPEKVKQLANQFLSQRPKPTQSRTRSELTQRAASIPDLRTLGERQHLIPNDALLPPTSPSSSLSRYSDDVSGPGKHFSSFNEEIMKTKVPLAPISRPGSAELLDHPAGSVRCWNQQQRLNEAVYNYHSPTHHHRTHSPSDVEAFKRKSAIVRPWEIDEQSVGGRDDASSPFRPLPAPATAHSRPSQKQQITQQQQQQQPYIQLSASNKYKADIIHFAKQNSPALPTPSSAKGDTATPTKFRYDDVSLLQHHHHANHGQDKTSRSRLASDQSLSPTFPMPVGGGGAPKPLQPPPSTIGSRTRSDSEETVSADEVEDSGKPVAQHIPVPPPSSQIHPRSSIVAGGKPSSELDLKQKNYRERRSHSPQPSQHHMMQQQQHVPQHLQPPHNTREQHVRSPQLHPPLHSRSHHQQQQQLLDERYPLSPPLPSSSTITSEEVLHQRQRQHEYLLQQQQQQQILFHRQREEEEQRLKAAAAASAHYEELRLLHLHQQRGEPLGVSVSQHQQQYHSLHLAAAAAEEEEMAAAKSSKRRLQQKTSFLQQKKLKEQQKLLEIQHQEEYLKQVSCDASYSFFI